MEAAWFDIFSLSWAVPLVLDSMISVAMAVYSHFVGDGDGIIYIFVWGFLAFSIGFYLIRMYLPGKWMEFFGLSGGEMYNNKEIVDGWSVARDVWRPMLRAIFAIVILLQVRPQFITRMVINPFLEFGAVYVNSITKIVLPNPAEPREKCPAGLDEYLSKNSCDFLVRPLDDLSRMNGEMIEHGFKFLKDGFLLLLLPLGVGIGPGLMNIVTGIVLIAVFFSMNFSMALLIIQGIFKFGLSLILYPFRVLIYVVKRPEKDKDDMWLNPWPALNDLIGSLKALVIAMIGVAFIMLVNVSVVGALFGFDLTGAGADSVGVHSITWLSGIMTFLIMFKVLDQTRDELKGYVNSDMTGFSEKVMAGAKSFYKNTTDLGAKVINALGKKES